MYGPADSNLLTYTRILLVCLLILGTRQTTQSQSIQGPPAADLAKTGIVDDISAGIHVYFAPTKTISQDQLPLIPFTIKGTKKFEHFIPANLVNNKAVLKFTLTNSSDQIQSVFFCPGFYYDSIQLFKRTEKTASPADTNNIVPDQTTAANRAGDTSKAAHNQQPATGQAATTSDANPSQAVNTPPAGQLIPVPDILPDDADSLGYRKISLAPHETSTFFVTLSFIKSPTNSINPNLTRDTLIKQGIILNHKNKTSIDVITNLFAGIMLMMIFYSISEYLQTGKPHFLYYVGYAACTSTLLFLKSTLHSTTTAFNFFFESYLDNIIFTAGNISYILFHRQFLETKKNYPALDRYLFWGAIAITVLTILYTIFFFFSPNFMVPNFIEDSTKILLMVILAIFIIKGLRYHNQLMNYIVCGNMSLILLAIISQVIISTNFHIVKGVSVLNLALFHYEVGITIELLFFLFALTYKNKTELTISIQKEEKLKLETERKELEKQVAVLAATQGERNRISADMHDELGSGVTAIRLMSEIVKSKMKERTLPEIEKISHSANELLNKMNTIIWTMTSSNDSVENLVAYIRSYAVEFFESTSIDCYFSMPASIPHKEISGEKRRNMFLSVKEALNNVLKHSQSSVVKINVTVSDRLIIEIQDDGVGINMEKLRKFGNGLNNMKKRMISINGEFDIQNSEGTRTIFSLVL